MSRRLFLLNGLAILAVVCVHAAIWGEITISWDLGCPFSVSNYDLIGALTYWGLTAIEGLSRFIVPAFLFVSGFFVSYAARGIQSTLNWRTVRVRIKYIIVPYLIWSIVIFIGDALQGAPLSPAQYLLRLIWGKANPPYYYVPLVCQFYLLSPLIVPLARTKGRLMLLVSVLMQLGVLGASYYLGLVAETPDLEMVLRITRLPLFPAWGFFFMFGVVSSFHVEWLRRLSRFRWALFVATVVLASLVISESEVLYRATGDAWWRTTPLTMSSSLYATFFILCFLAFAWASVPFSRVFYQLNKRIFGIYLLHWKVLEFTVLAIVSIAPGIISYQIFLQLVLIILGVGVPVLFMESVARSPAKKFYRYLFG